MQIKDLSGQHIFIFTLNGGFYTCFDILKFLFEICRLLSYWPTKICPTFRYLSGPAEPVRLVQPWLDQFLNLVHFFIFNNKTVNSLKSKVCTIIR